MLLPTLDPRSETTQTALIKAAANLFARHGFKATRTSDIAQLAETPISAINYHFGGKRGLYEATLAALATQRIAQHPLPNANLSAAERLPLIVKTFLNRLLNDDDSAQIVRLMMTEITDAGPALDRLVENIIRPQATLVIETLRELLGHDVSEQELQRWFLSFFGQCLVYQFAKPLVSKLFPTLYPTLNRDALAQHISTLMLNAIAARKAALQ